MAILSGGPLSSLPISGNAAAAAPTGDFIYDDGGANDFIQDLYVNEHVDLGTDSDTQSVNGSFVDIPLPKAEFEDNLPEDINWDWDNWSWSQAPPIDDNNPRGPLPIEDGSEAVMQILYLDLADYGETSLPVGANQILLPLGMEQGLDDQDFSDTSDYYSETSTPVGANAIDLLPGDISGLDDQDFTDLSDYGDATDPVGADGIPQVDIVFADGSGLDDQDWTDFEDYGSSSDPAISYPTQCVYPVVAGTVYANTTSGTTVSLTMPASIAAGDLLTIFIAHSNGNNISPSSTNPGWSKLFGTNSSAPNGAFFWKIADGTEGSSQSFDRSSGTAILSPYIVYRITGADARAPEAGTISNLTSATQPPASLDPTWAADPTLWLLPNAYDSTTATITTYPTGFDSNQTVQTDATDNYSVTLPTFLSSATSLAPSAWVMSVSTNLMIGTLAIKGACNAPSYPVSAIDSDDQDWTDFADYGDATGPVGADGPVADFIEVDVDDQDFTDLADYGDATDPVGADNNPDVCVDSIDNDDQDFTDFADYSSETPVPIDDNNPDICVDAIDSDDQDFTDLADYSFDSGPVVDDVNPDVCVAALQDNDDQDWTDHADYGSQTDITPADFFVPVDILWGDGSGLDDQDFTDTADYSFDDEFTVANPDFLIDILWGVEVDDQDFTDTADYGDATDPVGADNNPDICITALDGSGLDDQDWTDLADYGTQTDLTIENPVSEDWAKGLQDNDDQDFTDLSDYGDATDPVGADNNPDLPPPVEDYSTVDDSDQADYGSQTDPLAPDNNPNICVAAIALDDQDFTDFEDYGTIYQPLIDDALPPPAPIGDSAPGPALYQGLGLNRSIRLPDEVNDLMRMRRLQLKLRMKQLRENERRKRLLLAMIHALGILDDE